MAVASTDWEVEGSALGGLRDEGVERAVCEDAAGTGRCGVTGVDGVLSLLYHWHGEAMSVSGCLGLVFRLCEEDV